MPRIGEGQLRIEPTFSGLSDDEIREVVQSKVPAVGVRVLRVSATCLIFVRTSLPDGPIVLMSFNTIHGYTHLLLCCCQSDLLLKRVAPPLIVPITA